MNNKPSQISKKSKLKGWELLYIGGFCFLVAVGSLFSEGIDPGLILLVGGMGIGCLIAGVVILIIRRKQGVIGNKKKIEQKVLSLVQKHDGRLTPVLVATETGMGLEEAEKMLLTYTAKGYCIQQEDPDLGLVYKFLM